MNPNAFPAWLYSLDDFLNSVYVWIVQSAVFLSVTALLIMLFKLIFKNRLRAKWHFLIWAVLLVRFVIPFFPSSPVSVFNLANFDEQAIQNASVVNIISEEGYNGYGNEPHYNLSFGENNIPETDISGEHEFSPMTEVNAFHFYSPAAIAWAVGAAALVIYFIIVLLVYRQKLKRRRTQCDEKTLSVLNSLKEKLGIKRNVRLYFADTAPVLTGLFKPAVYIPDSYGGTELEAVITHELCHLKHLDILWSGIAALVLCLNWYNPVIWLSFFMFKRDLELYCDERTLKYTQNKQGYALLLLKTASKNKYVLGTTSLLSGKSDLKRRIRYLAKFKKPTVLIIIAAVLAAAAITTVCLTNANTKSAGQAGNYAEPSTEPTKKTEDIETSRLLSYSYDSSTQTFKIKGVGEIEPQKVHILRSSVEFTFEKEVDKVGWITDYELIPNNTTEVWRETITGIPKTIDIENGITAICANAFEGGSSGINCGFEYTERVNLPDSLKRIANFAFTGCENLSEIELPKNLTVIDSGAFFNCRSLKSITIPDRVDVIGRGAFSGCESLEEVTFGEKTFVIENYAFYGTSLKEINLSDGFCEVGDFAFFGCDFTSVTIPDTVFTIGEKAFGYTQDGKIDGFTIRGYADSTAEWYAKENGFKFEEITE